MKVKDLRVIKVFGRDFDDKKVKVEDQSIDLEEKSRFPPEVPSGDTAGRLTKRELSDKSHSSENDRALSNTTPAKPKSINS